MVEQEAQDPKNIFPFAHLEGTPDFPVVDKNLTLIDLNSGCSLDTIGRRAFTLRQNDRLASIPRGVRQALEWALQEVGYCQNQDEFEDFFLRDADFKDIRLARSSYPQIPVGDDETPFENLVQASPDPITLKTIDYLSRIGCEYDNFAGWIRMKARGLLAQEQRNSQETLDNLQALSWILKVTGDCPTPESFLKFVFGEEGLK